MFLIEIAEKLLEEIKMPDPSSFDLKTSTADIPLKKKLLQNSHLQETLFKEVIEHSSIGLGN